MARPGLPLPTSGPSVTSYLALALLVALVLALVLLTVNHGLLGHIAGLRTALGLRRG
ncbi:MAG TPA: hypothetical protein VMW80_12560 [Candidatus Dormibacteraeota bacterium]|nr:hypothetical protein [Candidatus Dormibacteraeota bacterium]